MATRAGRNDVEMTIAVEIAKRTRIRTGSHRETCRSTRETAFAVVERNRHVVVIAVHRDEIELVVTVQVTKEKVVGVRSLALFHDDSRLWRRCESALAIAVEDGYGVAPVTGERKIQLPVTAEVAQFHLGRAFRNLDRAARRWPKPAVA